MAETRRNASEHGGNSVQPSPLEDAVTDAPLQVRCTLYDACRLYTSMPGVERWRKSAKVNGARVGWREHAPLNIGARGSTSLSSEVHLKLNRHMLACASRGWDWGISKSTERTHRDIRATPFSFIVPHSAVGTFPCMHFSLCSCTWLIYCMSENADPGRGSLPA